MLTQSGSHLLGEANPSWKWLGQRVIGFEAGPWASLRIHQKPCATLVRPVDESRREASFAGFQYPFLSGARWEKTGLLSILPAADMLAKPLPQQKPGFHPMGEKARAVSLGFYFK